MTQPANAQRGETSIVVGGQLYLLRPSFTALVSAEEELGSLFNLVDRAAEGAISMSDITALVWHCLPVDGRPTREQVGDAIVAMGLLEATKPIRQILTQVLKGKV